MEELSKFQILFLKRQVPRISGRHSFRSSDSSESFFPLNLFSDRDSHELEESIWSAHKEVENFYNRDETRAVYERYYLSDFSV